MSLPNKRTRLIKSSTQLRTLEQGNKVSLISHPVMDVPNIEATSLGKYYTPNIQLENLEFQQEYETENEELHEVRSRVPQLTDLINQKVKPSEKDIQKQIIEVVKYTQHLENVLKHKNKKIERLEYIIKFLTIGQQKRDVIVQTLQDENRKLKELNAQHELHRKRMEQQPQLQSRVQTATKRPTLHEQKIFKRSDSMIPLQPAPSPSKKIFTHSLMNDEYPIDLLSIEIESMQQLNTRYSRLQHLKPISSVLGAGSEVYDTLTSMNHSQTMGLFDSIAQIVQEHKIMFTLIGQLRQTLQTSLLLSQQPSLNKSLEIAVSHLCECLECDRASVFVFDPEKEQLWTRVLKGTKEIRIPYTKGIVGHVFTSGQLVNVMNAYGDERFDKEADKMNNYRTTTILGCPIYDYQRTHVMGVVQVVNKFQGYFNKEDEILIQLISSIMGVSLKNSLTYDESMMYHNSLRNLLGIQEQLCSLQTEQTLIQTSEKQLMELFNVQHCRIYVFIPESDGEQMFRWEGNKQIICPTKLGLLGDAIEKGKITSTFSPYSSQLYNNKVDIETQLPLYSFPIQDPNTLKIGAAIQVVNARGIQVISTQHVNKITSIDYELLNYFGQFFMRKLNSLRN